MPVPFTNSIETFAVEFSHNIDHRMPGSMKAVDGISVSIAKGEFVAILGRNGSGKTTLARMLNALLLPTGGSVCIHGIDTLDESLIWKVRGLVGMIFQDPDSQIVGTTVEEDVAFGPENLGLEPGEIRRRVQEALHSVAMSQHAHTTPHLLSGGEKQKVSLAGILAMQPDCIILDEATALLDPAGRKEVIGLVRTLNRDKRITVLHITHDMEEARLADRVILLDAGKVVLDGRPSEVFSNSPAIKMAGLELPQIAELFDLLNQEGFDLPDCAMNMDEALAALIKVMNRCREQHVHLH
ncbi:MAG: energy-coupling factor transporter ATPase [Desulfuromonadaceae bacterium]|nr:energy-coupling factor transporter ATPase [Desulfuromonadaceae bacterium]MDD5106224.1 energy-coupling factor transporter ATPase [Desulfuromonadaceae bacterium]